ncbi:ABC transporter ATP-binding protein [Methanosphaerula palustris]|uniref:Molybdate/tungstate import ATP-binding protein WtpC n=1 Tax=Methanosphaerula palustris (strain ATCC BAA-1556 / DSM 19958 / E1-9c) TaxID=521011 RepID=B8GH16_METPE|nr:ABC transporter ATP-binding protein [Methanosphaerula palustris]ACL16421.1 ABC transporter related [Methanosphaerula palustris E1-9c]
MKLQVKNVNKEFITDQGEHMTALQSIDLEIKEGEFICILGPSGCGKTTLLRILAGLETPTIGEVRVDGTLVEGPSRQLAMIFQDYSLYPWRRVIDNTAFGLELQGIGREERYRVAMEYLKLVGLEAFADRYPNELSGGMRQRVAVARALAIDPAVILMDEPFGALDAQTRNTMQQELLDIWAETKKTVVFVTHSVDEAVYMADRIAVLSSRPGTIREIVPVGMDRPRDRTDVEFAKVRRYVLGLIEERAQSQ